jgi:hypothetical protein
MFFTAMLKASLDPWLVIISTLNQLNRTPQILLSRRLKTTAARAHLLPAIATYDSGHTKSLKRLLLNFIQAPFCTYHTALIPLGILG